MQRTKYFYVLDRQTLKAHYVGVIDGGLCPSVYDVLRPGCVPHVTDEVALPGDRIRLIATWFTVQKSPDQDEEG